MTSLWVEKYRPQKVADCVLSPGLEKLFENIVANTDLPQNMLLHGGPGIGKTTVARAVAAEKDLDVLFVNMSMRGNIDTLRTEIQQFASTVSLESSSGKLVIGDEFDYSNQQSTQPALRGMIEEFHESCRFFFTCNYPRRIIDPLLSRLTLVDFTVTGDDKAAMAKAFMRRLRHVLDSEGVEYDRPALAKLIIDRFPNFRKVINDCQRAYNEVGRIDASVERFGIDETFDELVGYMRERKFTEVRRWIGRNSDVDQTTVFRRFYDAAGDLVQKSSVPQLVLVLGEYQHKSAFVADHEINMAACLAEVMGSVEWK